MVCGYISATRTISSMNGTLVEARSAPVTSFDETVRLKRRFSRFPTPTIRKSSSAGGKRESGYADSCSGAMFRSDVIERIICVCVNIHRVNRRSERKRERGREYVCMRKRERQREKESMCVRVYLLVFAFACVCVCLYLCV